MTVADWILVSATVAGPVLAVQAQKWIEGWRDDRARRVSLFKTLMATRGAALSPAHVQSLNSIDLEFHGERYRRVRSSWRTYLDHLNSGPEKEANESADAFEARQKTWDDRRSDLLVDLLSAMGEHLGYSFDRVDLKRGAYTPQGHSELEMEQRIVRRLAIRVLGGEQGVKMEVTRIQGDPAAVEAHRAMVQSATEALKGGALRVSVENSASKDDKTA
jgi:hypothetical protein